RPSRSPASSRSPRVSASSSTSCRVRRAPPPKTSSASDASGGLLAGRSDARRAGPSRPRRGGAGIPSRDHMIQITLAEGDRVDWALKAFKRKVMKDGILKELRRRRHYVKPSEARQLKSETAQRRRKSAARRASRG